MGRANSGTMRGGRYLPHITESRSSSWADAVSNTNNDEYDEDGLPRGEPMLDSVNNEGLD